MSTPPTLDYDRSGSAGPRHLTKGLAVTLIVFAPLLFMLCVFPIMRYSRASNCGQTRCASNLRQLGQAIELYRHDFNGAPLPDLSTIVTSEELSHQVLICRSSSDTEASSVSELAVAGHCSYVYVAAGLTGDVSPDSVMAFDDPANHNLQGAYVLFGDGRVEWIDAVTFVFWMNELNAGRNPPARICPAGWTQAKAVQDYETNWKPRMTRLKAEGWRVPATQSSAPKRLDGKSTDTSPGR